MIEDFEDKKSEAGKRYTRFKTSEGWMSCWDKGVIEKLKDQEGKEVFVEIKTQGDFKNIKKILTGDEMANEDGAIDGSEGEEEQPRSRPVSMSELSKQAGVATRYAVDLFIADKIGIAGIKGMAQVFFKEMKELAES